MKELQLLHQLDVLLSFLVTGIDNDGVIDYFNSCHREFKELLGKLAKDGYITITTDHNNINHDINMPTIEGRLFLLNGGYVRKDKINKTTSEQNELFLSQSRNNERSVTRYTKIAAVGAWLVLFWYIFQWFYPNYTSFQKKTISQLIVPTNDNTLKKDTFKVYPNKSTLHK